MENEKMHSRAQNLLDNALEEWNNGNIEEASRNFDRAIETDNNFALAYLHRGAFKSSRGDYTAAIEDHKEGLKCTTDDKERASLLLNIALCELELGNLESFYEALRQAVSDRSWNIEKLISKDNPANKAVLKLLGEHPDKAGEVKNRINEIIKPHELR